MCVPSRPPFAVPSIALAVALAVAGCSGSSAPAPYAATVAGMTERIETHMADAQVTGLAIALVDGDQVVWARGFGWADLEARLAVDADTVFEIGSVSKTFAAAAVLQLVEEGRMDLDDPLASTSRASPSARATSSPAPSPSARSSPTTPAFPPTSSTARSPRTRPSTTTPGCSGGSRTRPPPRRWARCRPTPTRPSRSCARPSATPRRRGSTRG